MLRYDAYKLLFLFNILLLLHNCSLDNSY